MKNAAGKGFFPTNGTKIPSGSQTGWVGRDLKSNSTPCPGQGQLAEAWKEMPLERWEAAVLLGKAKSGRKNSLCKLLMEIQSLCLEEKGSRKKSTPEFLMLIFWRALFLLFSLLFCCVSLENQEFLWSDSLQNLVPRVSSCPFPSGIQLEAPRSLSSLGEHNELERRLKSMKKASQASCSSSHPCPSSQGSLSSPHC